MRLQSGYTQEGLADQVGCAAETVRRWELGVSYPRAPHVGRLCEIFQRTPGDLDILPKQRSERRQECLVPTHPTEPDETVLAMRAAGVRLGAQQALALRTFLSHCQHCSLHFWGYAEPPGG